MANEKRAPDIMDLEMLTPGSVWLRNNGKQSRYLFTLNTTLTGDLAKQNPQIAVYADENDNLFGVPVDAFIGKRTFHNVDPALEERLGNLLAFSAEDTGEEFDLSGDDEETLIVEDEGVSGEASDSMEAMGETDASIPQVSDEANIALAHGFNMFPVSYHAENNGLPEILPPELLSEMTESYQQQPLLQEGKLQHILYIRPGSGITREKLYASFSPTHEEQNAVYLFKVQTVEGTLEVDWDALVGIFPYVFQNNTLWQVIFTSSTEITYTKAEEAPAEAEVEFKATTDEAGQTVIAAAPVAQAEADEGAQAESSGEWVVPATATADEPELVVTPT